MSKAFTRESDDAPESSLLPRRASPLPAGAKNYVTASGIRCLREELERLLHIERPKALAAPNGGTRTATPTLDQHIAELRSALATAEIVPPPPPPWEQVRFGATVTVLDGAGEKTVYRIVGVDEADTDRDWVSWFSPLAKALLNARLGQRVRVRLPAGDRELEIIDIRYE